MTVYDRLRRASSACPDFYVVNATRGQALLAEIAELGRYTVTNDGVVAFTPFGQSEIEEARRSFAPNLSSDEFVQQLHVYATTLVGEGRENGHAYRFHLHEDGWRVQEWEGGPVRTTRMDDASFVAWLQRGRVARAA